MIYFVEEDTAQNKAFFLELECRGYKVSVIDNADKAFDELTVVQESDVDLVILDVMLAVASDGTSRFDRETTYNYIKTGLILLDNLVQCGGVIFPRKAVFFTNASSPALVREIEQRAKLYGIAVFRKADYDNPFDFADKIEELIVSLKS